MKRAVRIERWIKRMLWVFAISLLMVVWISNRAVNRRADGKIYHTTEDIPHQRVGLLLGTAKYLVDGRTNLYYRYRIDAAVQLFVSGKIDYIIVSGDNSTPGYDEPTTMKRDLVARGIPLERIYLDYAGFRTLDSMVRSREIFGQQEITVISQRFHVERAIYIAHRKGIKAIGFCAGDVGGYPGFKNSMRERLARVKMILDLLFGKQPRFLGDPVTIG
jgi:SanA protein